MKLIGKGEEGVINILNICMLSLVDSFRQFSKSVVESFSTCRHCSLNKPLSSFNRVETQLSSKIWHRKCAWEILFVGNDEKSGIFALFSIEHFPELVLGKLQSVMVAGVDHEDDAVISLVVVSPEHADLVLATDIPDGHGELAEFNLFHVESYRRDCGGDDVEF